MMHTEWIAVHVAVEELGLLLLVRKKNLSYFMSSSGLLSEFSRTMRLD